MIVECYLCGRSLDTEAPDPADRPTRDHVAPRWLFGSPAASNLITLPCCLACQAAYSKDEEYLRNNLAPVFPAGNSEKARELWETARRGIKRRDPILHDFVSRLRWVTLGEGGGAERRLAVTFEAGRTHHVFRKIARGLLYHHTGQRDPEHDRALVSFQPEAFPELQEMIEKAQFGERIAESFAYVGAFAPAEPHLTIWVLWLFDKVAVVALGEEHDLSRRS